MEGLAEEYSVTAWDMRGHGASSIETSGYTSDIIANDLVRLMDHLKIEKTAILGHSFGGVVGTHLATLHPDRVTALILSDVFFPGLRDLEPTMGEARVWQSLRETLLEVDTDIGETVDFPRLFSVAGNWNSEQQEHLRSNLGAVGERWLSGLARLSETTAGVDAFKTAGLDAQRIASTSVPVLAMYDEHSPFNATGEFLTKNLASCKQTIISDANHLAPLENPAQVIAETKTFLHSLGH